ncbi:MAG: hypothetical protein GF398_14545 [Chitinivibrionales bacterium]|nr:hypothetical protein [Chitinivibrionales bacterium]
MQSRKAFALCIIVFGIFSIGFRVSNSSIEEAVNMYLYDSLFFVSDAVNGIHVYSVADPANPRHALTIPILNNSGVAVRNNVIYANSGQSLVALKLHDDTLYDVVATLHSAYQYGADDFFYDGAQVNGWGCLGCEDASPISSSDAGAAQSTGVGGSYAIFSVIDTFLYYIDGQNIITLTIADAENPYELSQTYINWDIETLFPTREYLFIGAQTGMYILDRGNPSAPSVIGTFSHARACDPVVVQDSIAYVTLRTGTRCGGTQNELLFVDIANPENPTLIKQLNITTPYGLTVRDSLLYVGNGQSGFTLYNVAQPSAPRQVQKWSTIPTKDFIWYGDTLFIMGFTDFRIYAVSEPSVPLLVSTIE